MEPANFVALSKPFERSLLLNDMPILNIKPDLDADKIVPVAITNPRKCKVKSIGDVEFQFASTPPFCVWSLVHSRPRCFVATNCEDKAPCAYWCFDPKQGSLCFRDNFSVNTFAICRGNQISSPQHLLWLFHRYKSSLNRQLQFRLQMGWYYISNHNDKRYSLPSNDVSGFVSNFKGTWILTWNKIRRPSLLLLGRAVSINC